MRMVGKNTTSQLQRIVRGFANHRRIEMLALLEQTPELSVEEIAQKLEIDFKNAAQHLQRLAIAGLIVKRYESVAVRHKLTPRGRAIMAFLKKLE